MTDLRGCGSRSAEGAGARRLLACACVLLGTPGFVFCGLRHICVCGHMAHGNWPRLHWASDALWIIAFAIAMVASVRSDLGLRLPFVTCVATASLLRFTGPEMADLLSIAVAVCLSIRGLLGRGFAPDRDSAEVSEVSATPPGV